MRKKHYGGELIRESGFNRCFTGLFEYFRQPGLWTLGPQHLGPRGRAAGHLKRGENPSSFFFFFSLRAPPLPIASRLSSLARVCRCCLRRRVDNSAWNCRVTIYLRVRSSVTRLARVAIFCVRVRVRSSAVSTPAACARLPHA